MAATHTLTGNLFDLARLPLGAQNVRPVAVTNLPPGEALVDRTTNGIHLGGKPVTLNESTGQMSIDLIDTSATDLNVVANTLEYEIRAAYIDPANKTERTWQSGWFPLTADRNLADIATDVSPMAVQSASAFALEAKAARDEALTALDGALSDVVDISGIAVPDDTVEALLKGTAGAGAKTRAALSATFASIAQRPVNVLDFGADPTGATDSSAAIRSALAASGRIEFGKGGTFLVSRHSTNPWALSSPGEQVWSGQGATLKLANGTAPAVSMIRPLGNNVTVKDLNLDGNAANQSIETQKQRHGVFCDQVDNVQLLSMVSRNMAGDGLMLWRSTDFITVRDFTTYGNARNGASLTGSGQRIVFDNFTAYGVAAQAFDAECDTSGTYSNVRVANSYLAGAATDYAVDVTGLSTAFASDWSWIGNTILGGMHLVYFQRMTISGGNTIDGRSANKDCILAEYTADGLKVIGNNFLNSLTRRGIASAFITGATLDRMTISDNDFYLETGAAVQANGVNRLKITKNRASGTDTTNAFAAFKAEATRDVRSTIIEDNEVWGYARGVYTAGPNAHRYLRVANNYGHDDIAGMTYGTQLAGASSVYPHVVAYGNAAASGVTSAFSPPSGVWIRTGSGVTAMFEGTGTPEGVLAAPVGSVARRRDGGAATVLYAKESGTGATGWVAK